ncbi:MAG: hypothetical protein NC517_07590 [Firmicutes bacterium]|nr:hypothetical protein [Bacillota bacterium]
MKIRMQLISDAVFGSGESVPGGEDISILSDENGFPYYKGGTFKGIFREEMGNYLAWTMPDEKAARAEMNRLLGAGGDHGVRKEDRLVFSDFALSGYVKRQILSETGGNQADTVLDALSHIRTFTAISPEGIVQEGSLRQCRCINRGLNFYSELRCSRKDEPLVKEVLSLIKWVGTMRNRGFGKVKLTVIG